jgi:zinc/manganese transport system substrate-binding protein
MVKSKGNSMKQILLWIALSLSLTGAGALVAQDAPLNVVATTTLIADVAQNVGGDLVTVTSIVPYNTDIHAFQASPADAAAIAEADVVLVNGAGLEAFLAGLEENVTEVELTVVSNGVEMLPFAGEHGHEEEGEEHADEESHADEAEHADEETLGVLGVEAECGEETDHEEGEEHAEEAAEDEHGHGECDPHVWTDPNNVIVWANNIAAAYAAADPDNAETYQANAEAYIAQLEALDAEIEEILSVIPEDQRVLLTNHEFIGYFAHHYGFEVVATVLGGGTTDAELDPQQMADLITLVQDENVPAIFAEISANTQLADVIAAESGVAVVTSLYSDSLGGEGTPADTYINYVRYNAQTIADALAG